MLRALPPCPPQRSTTRLSGPRPSHAPRVRSPIPLFPPPGQTNKISPHPHAADTENLGLESRLEGVLEITLPGREGRNELDEALHRKSSAARKVEAGQRVKIWREVLSQTLETLPADEAAETEFAKRHLEVAQYHFESAYELLDRAASPRVRRRPLPAPPLAALFPSASGTIGSSTTTSPPSSSHFEQIPSLPRTDTSPLHFHNHPVAVVDAPWGSPEPSSPPLSQQELQPDVHKTFESRNPASSHNLGPREGSQRRASNRVVLSTALAADRPFDRLLPKSPAAEESVLPSSLAWDQGESRVPLTLTASGTSRAKGKQRGPPEPSQPRSFVPATPMRGFIHSASPTLASLDHRVSSRAAQCSDREVALSDAPEVVEAKVPGREDLRSQTNFRPLVLPLEVDQPTSASASLQRRGSSTPPTPPPSLPQQIPPRTPALTKTLHFTIDTNFSREPAEDQPPSPRRGRPPHRRNAVPPLLPHIPHLSAFLSPSPHSPTTGPPPTRSVSPRRWSQAGPPPSLSTVSAALRGPEEENSPPVRGRSQKVEPGEDLKNIVRRGRGRKPSPHPKSKIVKAPPAPAPHWLYQG